MAAANWKKMLFSQLILSFPMDSIFSLRFFTHLSSRSRSTRQSLRPVQCSFIFAATAFGTEWGKHTSSHIDWIISSLQERRVSMPWMKQWGPLPWIQPSGRIKIMKTIENETNKKITRVNWKCTQTDGLKWLKNVYDVPVRRSPCQFLFICNLSRYFVRIRCHLFVQWVTFGCPPWKRC